MRRFCVGVALLALGFGTAPAGAATITFDTVIVGETTFAFGDVVFSTTDPLGFNTLGPGPNQTYINEPGLEGTSLLSPDLRVDFSVGATGSITFGFALNSTFEDFAFFASFTLFDAFDNVLGSDTEQGLFTFPDTINPSSFPEGQINVVFAGTAAYGLFDFNSEFGRYIIDDFDGNFGVIPEPSTALLMGLGLMTMGFRSRRSSP